jgi:hypothetical protein
MVKRRPSASVSAAKECSARRGDEAEIVSDATEDDVVGVAGSSFEVAATKVVIGLHVADRGLVGRTAPQFTFDAAERATLLAGDKDAARVLVVAAIAFVHLGALDRAAGEPFGGGNHATERVAIVRIAGSAVACRTNTPPGARALVVVSKL